MGECLYSLGQFDEAQDFYTWVITTYPESPKVEVATYRIDLIKQKKIEAELLALLQWSHEEALRTSEEYQRRLRTYEYTLNNYQRRITELQAGGAIHQSIPTPEIDPESLIIPEEINIDENGNGYEQEIENEVPQAPEEPFNELDNGVPTAEHLSERDLLIKARNLSYELQYLINNYDHGGQR